MVGQNSDAAASAADASTLLEEEAAADAPRMRVVELVNFMMEQGKVYLIFLTLETAVGTTHGTNTKHKEKMKM